MKKTIAFMLPALRMGGAEVIALNYIKKLCDDYKITIILNKTEGELLSEVPFGVEIVEDRLSSFGEILKKDIKHLAIPYIIKDLIYYLKIKTKKNKEKDWLYLISRSKKNDNKYDVLICFVANVSTQIFRAVKGYDSPKKIAWIHGETNELKDIKLYNKLYSSFNDIVCVSNTTKEHFANKFTLDNSAIHVLYNPIDKENIIKKSNESIDTGFDKTKLNIVSVGRLSPEKGFTMIPSILKLLNKEDVMWHLIGDGPSKNAILLEMKKLSISNLFLHGSKSNPYPYIKNSDLYVQPSFEEGYGMAICEAAILHKVIVATNCCGIREIVSDKEEIIFCEPKPEIISETILKIIKDKEYKKKIVDNVAALDFSRSDSLELIIRILNN